MKYEELSNEKAFMENEYAGSFYPLDNEHFRFPVYLSKTFSETSVEELELSVRSTNCLRRAGIHTIGDLCETIDGYSDLLKIRNCGRNSSVEIMEKLFFFQYHSLSQERQKAFLKRVVEVNS